MSAYHTGITENVRAIMIWAGRPLLGREIQDALDFHYARRYEHKALYNALSKLRALGMLESDSGVEEYMRWSLTRKGIHDLLGIVDQAGESVGPVLLK